MYLLNQLTHADNDFMEFVLSPVAWRFERFMKTRRYGASVHFGVVVVELINCKCGGIVTNQIW